MCSYCRSRTVIQHQDGLRQGAVKLEQALGKEKFQSRQEQMEKLLVQLRRSPETLQELINAVGSMRSAYHISQGWLKQRIALSEAGVRAPGVPVSTQSLEESMTEIGKFMDRLKIIQTDLNSLRNTPDMKKHEAEVREARKKRGDDLKKSIRDWPG
jgi:translation initiation factor 2B subunit (eIF-2B alpha/beta/delta family)